MSLMVDIKRTGHWKLILIFFMGLAMFWLFGVFSWIVRQGWLSGIDFAVSVKIQDRMPELAYRGLMWFSQLGGIEISSLILAVIVILKRRISSFGYLVFFGLGLSIVWLLRLKLEHPAPIFMFYRASDDFSFSSYYTHSEYSYPSGHSFRWTYVCVVGNLLFLHKITKVWKAVWLGGFCGMIFLMDLSKVALGQHWTTDVIGGTLLGLSMSLLGASLVYFSSFAGWFLWRKLSRY